MENNYSNYKNDFRSECLWKLIAFGLGLLTLALLLFMPLFGWKVDGKVEGAYSVWDEVKDGMDFFKEVGFGKDAYPAIAVAGILITALSFLITCIVVLVKAYKNYANLDDYALEEYDRIKTHERLSRRARTYRGEKGVGAVGLIIGVGVLMYMSNYLFLLWTILQMDVSENTMKYIMETMKTFTVDITPAIVVIVAAVATTFCSMKMKSIRHQAKLAILKEDKISE